ncbi:MAG TPA: hypothetical protein VE153_21275, partial [Myxococcus sp.]|nr:hypothetical protein [Myxococcus sp.]
FIEEELLRERLLESVYYLHAQPPLFNLLLGGVLQAFGEAAPDAFTWLYRGFGLLMAGGLYGLLVRLRVPRWPSALLTVFFVVSPASLLFENWLFYTYPEALLLCAAALLFHRFASSGRLGDGVALFATLGALALSRSLFHLAWYLAMGVLLRVAVRHVPRRTVGLAASGPLLLILALYTKNALHFGTFSASSWFGMNFAQVVLKQAPLEARRELARSPDPDMKLALYAPFQALGAYPPEYRVVSGPDVPVLRRELKPSGWSNFNHVSYVGISKAYSHVDFAAVRAWPGRYLDTVLQGVQLFLTPASDYPFVADNRAHLTPLSRVYNPVLLGMYGAETAELGNRWLTGDEIPRRILWNWVALIVLGLGAAGVRVVTEYRRTRTLSPEGATLLFLATNILYVTLVSNLFEYGENNRLRYPIDPLVLAQGAAGVTWLLRTFVRRPAPASP